ncbi:hypothetical protein BDZ89DRAFT_1107659 [Hymenopellis radicata]|nr:hypothetical protein BDZ89DRAFT_1107659 [Hymenopellis radicata]
MGATNPNNTANTPAHLAPFLVNNTPVPDEGQLRAQREADLAEIQKDMSRLMGEHDAVASAYAAVLSPVRRVPPEIWTEVFKYCATWPAWLEIHLISTFPPWIYSRVCASWRAIVFSMPRLWEENIRIHAPECMALKDPAAILRTVVNLCSPTHGFTFRFFGSRYGKTMPMDAVPGLPLLELLIQESPRWRSASLHLACQGQVDVVAAVRGRLQLLSSLNLSCNLSDALSNWKPESIRGFEDAPALTRLHIDGSNWKFEERSRFPWSQLSFLHDGRTCVEDEPVDSTYYTDILSQSPGLEYVKIMASHEPNVVPSRVVHTGVKSLEFCDCSILSNFAFPNLTRITRSNDLFAGAEDTPMYAMT